MFGLLNLRKSPGPTSHDVVAQVRRRLTGEVKVGHAGTLDPFAEGVLVLCLGPATRLAGYVQAQPKRYVAQVTLGATSDTDDPTGRVTAVPAAQPPSEDRLRDVLKKFVGTIEQTPPAHSAVHVEGQRAYKLARAGKEFDLAPRPVVVHRLDLLSYTYPQLDLAISCSSGTYVRSLARDIGSVLGCGGYCSRLNRTAVGIFTADRAIAPEHVDPARHLLPPILALGDMPRLMLDTSACLRLAMGQSVWLSSVAPGAKFAPATELAILNEQGDLVAIGILADDGLTFRPAKVFLPSPAPDLPS